MSAEVIDLRAAMQLRQAESAEAAPAEAVIAACRDLSAALCRLRVAAEAARDAAKHLAELQRQLH